MKSGTRIGDGLIWIDVETASLRDGAIPIITIRSNHCTGDVLARAIVTSDMAGSLRLVAQRCADALDHREPGEPSASAIAEATR